MSKFAWVTLATNDSYSLGALVVANSLKRVHTAHQLAVLITPGVSESMKTRLRSVFNVVQEVNLLDSKDEANLALLKRPELGITFTKLHCWRLTQFEKCVFLDADTLVLRNCDELFEREELSAAPDVGWPDCFNSGVYVYRPSLDTFSSLIQFAVSHGSFDGGDQGLLNSYFSDWAHTDISKHLPFIYNTSTVASYSYLPAFKQFGQNTKILHFIGTAKPWLQNFNSETRKVYVPHGYQHLTNFLQFWWDVFCEDVHSRLSSDMQRLFDRWIKPVQVSDSGSGAYRSSGTGTVFNEYGNYGGNAGAEFIDTNGNFDKTARQQQQLRDAFIPRYDEKLEEYVDPWEEYHRKQDEERERRAQEAQKREELRLYYEYLDSLPQEHQRLQHGVQEDATNVFQSSEQWVQYSQQHDQMGPWEPEPAPPSPPHYHDSSSDQQQHQHYHDHHHHQPLGGGDWQHKGGEGYYGDGGGGSSVSDDRNQSQAQHHQLHDQQHQHQQEGQRQHDHAITNTEESGLAGALSQLHLGEPKSIEQEAYEEHMRRQCWETGNIDYMGRDSFDNIWRRIQATLDAKAAQTKASTEAQSAGAAAATPIRAISPAPPKHRRSAKSRSRSTTPKRDPRDRSPTPQPEDNVPVEKKEVQIEPPILEEEDSLSATSGQVQDQGTVRSRPMTPLTEKVFAGPQATSGGVDVVDAPQKEAVTPPRSEPSPAPQAASSTPPPPQPMREEPPVAIPSPVASAAPSPSRSSPRPQPPPLQVAEESMAGKPYKTVASEPVRTVRRKQLVSPPQAAPAATVTTTSTMTQTKTKPRIVPAKTATTVSSIPIKPIRTVEEPSEAPPSLIKRTTNSVTHTNATVKPQTKTLPTIASSLTSSSQQASSPLVPSSLSPISQDGSKAAIASSTLEDQLPPSTSPPVPPRRKRESKVAQIGKAPK
ncbi:G-box-binding factor-like isoform X2 [Uranotaenia lowii]|uniref:G-box-binding factor-like isoform X2 n=1 Tax=Uranotaenia lowii TaxID=190385 RepID=UPI00247A6D1C|nr:G-box-binding factor-like isoform X2 [Uranotaenia lowii]